MTYMYLPETLPPILRSPNFLHAGKNGYTPTHVEEIPEDAEPTRTQLDYHRRAQYILTQKDRPIPSLEQMREENEQDELTAIKNRIAAVQEQHLSDLQRLYSFHAEEYYDEAVDRYLSKDDLMYLPEGENNPAIVDGYAQLDEVYTEARRNLHQQMLWEDEIDEMRYAHLSLLTGLYKRQREEELRLEAERKSRESKAEEERRLREADFPTSIEDYHGKSKDVQHRVARFLVLDDSAKQEKMLHEYQWAWRQVKPLQEIYQKNPAFQSEILVTVMDLNNSRDPRKRI